MRARSLLCVLIVVGLSLAVPSVAAYEFFPEAKSELQRDWQVLFTKVLWAALVVFVLVEFLIVYAIIRFRKRKDGPKEGPHVHGNTKMEVAWTIAPTLVLAWLLVVSLEQMEKTDNNPPEPDFDVQVVGRQFLWEFYYPDGTKAPINELRVEQGRVVGLHVTSGDVIHAFNVPELGVMIDAVPGRTNFFWFRADEPGEYFSQCRELCGVGHGRMHATVIVFEAGSQSRPYGAPDEPSITDATGTTSPEPTATNATGEPTSTNATSTAAPGETREVRLIDFAIEPQTMEAQPGTKLVLNVVNAGRNPHNLYIGQRYDPAAENSGAEWFSEDLEGGQETLFEVELPAEPGAWEWWCNVPGHYESGMRGTLSTGGQFEGGSKPLLPGFELPLVILAALGVALFAARRRK